MIHVNKEERKAPASARNLFFRCGRPFKTEHIQPLSLLVGHHIGIILRSHITGHPESQGNVYIAYQNSITVDLQPVRNLTAAFPVRTEQQSRLVHIFHSIIHDILYLTEQTYGKITPETKKESYFFGTAPSHTLRTEKGAHPNGCTPLKKRRLSSRQPIFH